MFCAETVEKAYAGMPNNDRFVQAGMYLDCYSDLALYLTEGYREILETEHCYISIQHNGVFLLEKCGPVETIGADGEFFKSHLDIDTDEDLECYTYKDYKWTLFVGEKLTDVTKTENGFLLHFTDFELKLIPHENDIGDWGASPRPYCRVFGTERLIKPCTCGGRGLLYLDFASDYLVRCEKCHRGTAADMCADDVINEWNDKTDIYDVGDFPHEEFEELCYESVDFMAIESIYGDEEGKTGRCKSVVVSVRGKNFNIKSAYLGGGKYGFAFEIYCYFNPKVWNRRIVPSKGEHLRFVARENGDRKATLRFSLGKRELLITADSGFLTITDTREKEA